jgi:transposase
VVEIKEALRLWARGHGLRTIAGRTGLDRKTIRRHVDVARELGLEPGDEIRAVDDLFVSDVVARIRPGAPTEAGAMRGHCRSHVELVEDWLKKGCKGPKIVRLLHRHTGVKVPLRTLQRFVREELQAGEGGTVRVVDPPAGVLEVDFLKLGAFEELASGTTRAMYALLCTASVSRHQFLWPCLQQDLDAVIGGLEAAWPFFGGVFPVLLPDNLKAVVDEADPIAPVFNRDFLEYAQARGFEIDPARVRKAKDKARVERQVQYSRNDYFKGENFGSVEEARIAARQWCLDEAGQRIHGRTRRRPLEAFESVEKEVLLPPPDEVYDMPRWGTFKVGRDHAVVVDYALYTVPHLLGECKLRVRRDRSTVKMYKGGQLVKVHPKQPEGGTHIDPADLPPEKAALATRDTEPLCVQADGFGQHVGIYARRLAEGPLPWSRMRHVYRLLGLARRYGAEITDEACARALEVDVVDVHRISRMLENGLKERRLIRSDPPPVRPQATVLRFARPKSAFRTTGGPDASA